MCHYLTESTPQEALVDQFEAVIRTLLEADHYWVQSSFKLELDDDGRRQIGNKYVPRPEIDLLALKFSSNEVLAVEAKSFIDSAGVRLADLEKRHRRPEGRYKLFTSIRYRNTVLSLIKEQLCEHGMANAKTKMKLMLAVGNVSGNNTAAIADLARDREYDFWSPTIVKEKVTALERTKWINDPVVITSKILLRKRKYL